MLKLVKAFGVPRDPRINSAVVCIVCAVTLCLEVLESRRNSCWNYDSKGRVEFPSIRSIHINYIRDLLERIFGQVYTKAQAALHCSSG